MIALSDYNKNPYDVDTRTITFAEVWEHWCKDNYEKGSESAQSAWRTGFKHCTPVHSMKLSDIKLAHLEGLITGKKSATQIQIKSICSKVFKHAMKHEWIEKDPSTYMETSKREKSDKKPFTEQEIADIWEKVKDDEFYELILILLYTGMRIREFLSMKQCDVHDGYMIGGSKTEAGKDRIIPIHSRIRPFVEKRLDGTEYLLHNDGKPLSYQQFRLPFMKRIPSHTVHETRHTFISRMHSTGVNETTLKIIVGHARRDITSKVYIHKTKDELIDAVEKLV